jgi:hypothetical protein
MAVLQLKPVSQGLELSTKELFSGPTTDGLSGRCAVSLMERAIQRLRSPFG